MNEDRSLEEFKNLSEKVNNLSRSVEGLEKSVRDVLRSLTPANKRIVPLDEVFKNPREYIFNFMNGLTIGGLIKQKEVDGVINRSDLKSKLVLSSELFDDLLADRSLPNAAVFSQLIDTLGVQKSDLMVCKANTYLKIKSEPNIKTPTLEEVLKPCVRMETLPLVEKIAGEERSVLAFLGNLFVKNISEDFFSLNSKDYNNKSVEEVTKIIKLRKQPNIILLEYPINDQQCAKKPQFALDPTEIIHRAMTGYSTIFPRLVIEGDPKFYKITEQDIDEYWIQLQDLENGGVKTIEREEFEERWEKANHEMILILPAGKSFSGWSSLIKNIVDEAEYAFDKSLVDVLKSHSSFLGESKEIIYNLFKNKWLSGKNNDLLYFASGSEMDAVIPQDGKAGGVVVDGKTYNFTYFFGLGKKGLKKYSETKLHFKRRSECREETMRKFKDALKKLED